jgi:hypothetical protein
MVNERLVVQFIHPGGEHQPDGYDHKDWNKGPHKRKFLLSPGSYVSDKSTKEGSIVFWGEWEPQSRVVKRYANPVPDGPHFLYEPYYRHPSSFDGLQNTDPFVFGEQFHFSICQQNTKVGATQLRYLDRGSNILFGSCIDKERFVVDTVFVVDSWIDYLAGNHTPQITTAVSGTYLEVTLKPGCNGEDSKGQRRRLYFGATPQKPVDGMYSFFPCLPLEKAPSGFARPTITLPGLITPHLTQGRKTTPITGSAHGVELWADVKAQVERQGLSLGTFVRLPEKKT